jgi:hypothetical protein
MVIFHSYVKLPEGNHLQLAMENHDTSSIANVTLLEDLLRYPLVMTNINCGKIHHL